MTSPRNLITGTLEDCLKTCFLLCQGSCIAAIVRYCEVRSRIRGALLPAMRGKGARPLWGLVLLILATHNGAQVGETSVICLRDGRHLRAHPGSTPRRALRAGGLRQQVRLSASHQRRQVRTVMVVQKLLRRIHRHTSYHQGSHRTFLRFYRRSRSFVVGETSRNAFCQYAWLMRPMTVRSGRAVLVDALD